MRKTLWKLALATLSAGALAMLAGCVADYDGDGYADDVMPDGVYYDYGSGGYCDAWGCPGDFYDMPVYYGSVFYGGQWYNGPHYYRDYGGQRQYWVHGGWHNDGWQGARPNWWREGRTSPALGRDFYRSDRFRNSGAFRRDQGGGGNRGARDRNGDGRPDFNRGGGGNGQPAFSNGRFNNNATTPSQTPQAQPQDGGRRFGGQGFQRSERGNRDGGSRANGGGGGNRGGGGGGNRGGGGGGNRGGGGGGGGHNGGGGGGHNGGGNDGGANRSR
jgi:hypothetical protein